MSEVVGEADSGLYALLIELRTRASVAVGRLGRLTFSPGYYVYVGSAKLNLRSRLARHWRRRKRLHWHVDYLLRRGRPADAVRFPWRAGGECALVRSALDSGLAHVPAPGFGSSDCRCPAHLLRLAGQAGGDWACQVFARWPCEPQPWNRSDRYEHD